MADFALFVGFGFPARGREQQSAKLFGEAVELWTRWQEQGEIEGWETFFLEPHGGDLGGFFLLRGERDALARLRAGDELNRLSTRAQLIVDGFGVVGAQTGGRVEQQLGVFLEAAGELG
jgi:hypothetical protein